jgi:hypothetical protein
MLFSMLQVVVFPNRRSHIAGGVGFVRSHCVVSHDDAVGAALVRDETSACRKRTSSSITADIRRLVVGVDLITFQDGAARFFGSVRGSDEWGHDAFELRLPSFPPLYGEYQPKWADNEYDFDIEIISFGFTDARNIANPNIGARRRFSSDQRRIIEGLIAALVSSPEAQTGVSPFSSKKARFLGHVFFRPNWIVGEG